ARTITDKFHDFEKNVTKKMAEIITPEQQEALNQLIINDGEYYERVLLTRLKTINQSMRPAKIKQGIRNFLIIKKLHQELMPLIKKLELSSEATKYYAGWVNKAKATQIAEMADLHKRNLHLVAFIDHWYRLWQDTFVDILLKAVQQQVNKAAREVDLLVKSRLPEKNKLTESVLSGFNEASDTLHEVRTVVHDNELNNDEKIQKLHKILPAHKENNTLSQAEDAAKKLYDQIEDENKRTDEFDALGNLSRKLQNRV
ncbi:TPA: Tn3 family transposase, partial [Legionella pneumophila]|nr:Tn3 family transposase [Legionella pneumophila]